MTQQPWHNRFGRAGVMSLILAVGMAGTCLAADAPAKGGDAVNPSNARAVIKTKLGDIEIKFLPDVAPKHVENFMKLARSGFYNGTIFHRVIPGFMIQGGDPNTKDSLRKEAYGQGGPGHNVKGEFSDLPHKRGVVSMARAQDPDSAGSQFFVVVEESRFLDRKYTIFAEVVKGIGVADKIVALPRVMCQTGAPNPADKGPCDNPIDRVEMTVTIIE